MAEGDEQVTGDPTEVLVREAGELRTAAFELDTLLRAHPDLAPSLACSRAWQLAQDVWVATETFRLLFVEATEQHQKQEVEQGGRLLLQFGGALTETSASDRFRGAFKSLLFAVRAYQDGMYVLLNCLRGERTTGGSMDSALKNEKNLVGELVRAALPEYFPWFAKWRKLRNDIKKGVSLGIVGPTDNLGISVNWFTKGGGQYVALDETEMIIRFADIFDAVHISRRLAQLARVTVEGRVAGYK
jgi:hypothetical protein